MTCCVRFPILNFDTLSRQIMKMTENKTKLIYRLSGQYFMATEYWIHLIYQGPYKILSSQPNDTSRPNHVECLWLFFFGLVKKGGPSILNSLPRWV